MLQRIAHFPLSDGSLGENRGTKYEMSTNTVWRPVGELSCLCYLWRRWCSGRRVACLVGPGCAVGGGPPASRPRREPSARRVGSLSGQALPPPTGTAARPCLRPRALQPGPTTPACHMRPQSTDARARFRSLRGDRRPGGACLAGPRPRPLRLRVPRRSLRLGARRGLRPSRTASSGAGPSRCSSSRPRTPNR